MTKGVVAVAWLCVWASACAGGEDGRGASRGRSSGAVRNPGSGGSLSGPDDFGNADDFQAPVTDGAVFNPTTSCKAGYYLGQVEGLYESSAAFGFTPGGIPITTDPNFIATDILNKLFPPMSGISPGLEFWLTASDDTAPCEVGEEFCFDYQVEGGKARGVANGLFPFEFDMNGQLDCGQGHFEGLVENGWYEVVGIRFFFAGEMWSDYDEASGAFQGGMWEVREDGLPNTGGHGTWFANWTDMP